MSIIAFGALHRFHLSSLQADQREQAKRKLLDTFGQGVQTFRGQQIFVMAPAQTPDTVSIATGEGRSKIDAQISEQGQRILRAHEGTNNSPESYYCVDDIGYFEPASPGRSPRHRDAATIAMMDAFQTVHFYTPDGTQYLGADNPFATSDEDVKRDTYVVDHRTGMLVSLARLQEREKRRSDGTSEAD